MTDVPVLVREDAHWEIIFRPSSFEPTLIKTLSECKKVVEDSRITLRGWDYPSFNPQNLIRGNDYIGCWDEFHHHREYWRFFQSGQFFHLLAFRENWYKDRFERQASKAFRRIPEDYEPSGYIDFVSTILTLTEIALFASNVAARTPFPVDGSVQFRVSMRGMKNRVLTSWDVSRDLWDFYHTPNDNIRWESNIAVSELLADPKTLALDAAQHFFERFGWDNPPEQVFRGDQQKFLERRL
ncbi:MAG: hypothetical protein GX604_00615 [Actinobacteria bacterium]|nr:hypothetical protein [Actinomycetota bacterium]